MSHREAAAQTGVPLTTLRYWIYRRGWRAAPSRPICPECDQPEHRYRELPPHAYSYLLGAYLGDGCIFGTNGAYRLRITLDEAYPWIVLSVGDAIEDIRGRRPHEAPDYRGKKCVTLTSYWRAWACLLPQHGPGRKHSRPIVLSDWQQQLVDQAPQAFLRGLIHTDGWRGLNKVHVKGKDYAYPRYQFSNRSDDIRCLFTDTCDALGIAWRPWGRWHISVARKEAVAAMDTFIGPKC